MMVQMAYTHNSKRCQTRKSTYYGTVFILKNKTKQKQNRKGKPICSKRSGHDCGYFWESSSHDIVTFGKGTRESSRFLVMFHFLK